MKKRGNRNVIKTHKMKTRADQVPWSQGTGSVGRCADCDIYVYSETLTKEGICDRCHAPLRMHPVDQMRDVALRVGMDAACQMLPTSPFAGETIPQLPVRMEGRWYFDLRVNLQEPWASLVALCDTEWESTQDAAIVEVFPDNGQFGSLGAETFTIDGSHSYQEGAAIFDAWDRYRQEWERWQSPEWKQWLATHAIQWNGKRHTALRQGLAQNFTLRRNTDLAFYLQTLLREEAH